MYLVKHVNIVLSRVVMKLVFSFFFLTNHQTKSQQSFYLSVVLFI